MIRILPYLFLFVNFVNFPFGGSITLGYGVKSADTWKTVFQLLLIIKLIDLSLSFLHG